MLLADDVWAVVCAKLVRAAQSVPLDDPEPEDEPRRRAQAQAR
jgi:hypothetical protein